LQHAHRELTRELESRLAERYGLSLSALELLGRLAASDRRRRRLSWLAGDVKLSVSRVSRIADALERRGLLERQPCEEDTRATYACLTDAGLALAREAQASHLADVQDRFLNRLSERDLCALGETLARLR
jgi:DNA-binding MarR family transcriptional regulator